MRSLNNDDAGPPVPRIVETAYGLYPGQDYFSDEYTAQDYCDWVEQSNGDPLPAPLALYIRDCDERAEAGTAAREIAGSGIPQAIQQELRMQGALFAPDRPVQQLIFTGNIAATWTDDQLYALVSTVRDSFTMGQDAAGWCACMGTAGSLPPSRLRLLQVLGFSHLRFAIPQTAGADAASRYAMLDAIEQLAGPARSLGLRELMVDLYFSETAEPLALQKLQGFIDSVGPERIRLIEQGAAPGAETASSRREAYAGLLAALGYENIGLDWFVRAGDLWSRTRFKQPLHWSLLGYTEMPSPDVVGVGPGAVSTIGDFYSQNEHRWHAYQELVSEGLVPIARGLELESDDRLRREIMNMILTGSRIDVKAVENKWGIQFNQFFAHEMRQLHGYQKRNWVAARGDSIAILARGRPELSELCRVFDHRLRMAAAQPGPLETQRRSFPHKR